jgi:hypothetical protein
LASVSEIKNILDKDNDNEKLSLVEHLVLNKANVVSSSSSNNE